MGQTERSRSNSFALLDEAKSSGILSDVLLDHDVFLGGSSLGKGLAKAAKYYMKNMLSTMPRPNHFNLPGAADIAETAEMMPLEDSFYVVDLGVLVSQVYQCTYKYILQSSMQLHFRWYILSNYLLTLSILF